MERSEEPLTFWSLFQSVYARAVLKDRLLAEAYSDIETLLCTMRWTRRTMQAMRRSAERRDDIFDRGSFRALTAANRPWQNPLLQPVYERHVGRLLDEVG